MASAVRKRRDRARDRNLAKLTSVNPGRDAGPWEDLTRSDCGLIRKAVRDRWPVAQPSRLRLMDTLFGKLKADDKRLVLSVSRTVVTMDQVNCDDEIELIEDLHNSSSQISGDRCGRPANRGMDSQIQNGVLK